MEHPMHPCPACGYYVFSSLNEQSEICPICGWQNDLVDLQEMYQSMGPNNVSLEEAQKIFAEKGPQKTLETFEKDAKWRPLDRQKDKPRAINADSANLQDLYYWLWN